MSRWAGVRKGTLDKDWPVAGWDTSRCLLLRLRIQVAEAALILGVGVGAGDLKL